MPEPHPSRDSLERFARGRGLPAENRAVVRHLLTGCRRCSEAARSAWPFPEKPAETGELPSRWRSEARHDVSAAFRRALTGLAERQGALARERAAVEQLLEELLAQPPARRRVLAENSRRFHTWSLGERLAQEAFEAGFRSPAEARELAELALLVARLLPEESYGSALVHDLQARTWGILGNARRIGADLRGAEEAFAAAREALARGTGDLQEEARLLDLEASLRGEQERFAEAVNLLDRVASLYRRAGDRHLVGRALASKGMILARQGNFERAVTVLKRAQPFLDTVRDPRVALAAHHNLIFCLQGQGRNGEAWRSLAKALPVYHSFGDPYANSRLKWLEGKIAAGLGREREAEHCLISARTTLLAIERPLDSAQVCLDLAVLYLEQGRTTEVRELAAAMLPIFRSRQLDRGTLAALLVFRRAVEMERLTVGLVRQVARRLERARQRPVPRPGG